MLYYISTRITNTILFSFYLKPYDLFEKDIQTRSFIHSFFFRFPTSHLLINHFTCFKSRHPSILCFEKYIALNCLLRKNLVRKILK